MDDHVVYSWSRPWIVTWSRGPCHVIVKQPVLTPRHKWFADPYINDGSQWVIDESTKCPTFLHSPINTELESYIADTKVRILFTTLPSQQLSVTDQSFV
jgi:hypothetical protein